MKNIYLLILFLFACCSTFAQTRIDSLKPDRSPIIYSEYFPASKLYLYTVGIKVFDYRQFPKLLNQENSDEFRESYARGILFKFNDNQIAYRIGGDFYNKTFSFANECRDCEFVFGRMTDYDIKIGFEKMLSYGVFQPYLGLDVGFERNRFKGDSRNASAVAFTAPYQVIAEKNGGIIAPVLGFKVNALSHLSIAVEGTLDVFYNYERQEKTYQDEARTSTFTKRNNWEFLPRPVSVGLQYNFGKTD